MNICSLVNIEPCRVSLPAITAATTTTSVKIENSAYKKHPFGKEFQHTFESTDSCTPLVMRISLLDEIRFKSIFVLNKV